MTFHERLLQAVLSSREVDDLLRATLGLLLEAGGMDLGVIRVGDETAPRDGLRSRVAVGLEEEVDAKFTSASDDSAARGVPVLTRLSLEDPRVSEPMRRAGAVTAYWLAFPCDPLSIAACLGCRRPDELDAERAALLQALATSAATAVGRLHAFNTLERSIREREQILADIAHDLKNSIHAVALSAEVLVQRLEPGSPLLSTVNRIARNTQRAATTVENLLSNSVIEAGKLVLREVTLGPAELILTVAEAQQDAGVGAKILITTDLTPGLPLVRGDQERLLEVFDNLVGNALKFTKPGGTISLGAAPRDDHVLFWVKDTGAGIPKEDVPRVFERYFRARRGERKGSGLGLTICKGIVEAHGGRIWAESMVGEGTTMLFTLPVVETEVGTESQGTPKILLVDDRVPNLQALEAILESQKYRILKATSGQEALRTALQEELAVVVLDIDMPGMNGLEVAAHLKLAKRTRSIPIIFITAYGDDTEQVYRAYAAGGADYMVKPLDPEIVRRKVAVFAELGRGRARRRSDPAPPPDRS
jgi:signal transduction histidine kinase/ActR/RegA family two-component response regulator